MKLLSATEIVYSLFTVQVCVFASLGYVAVVEPRQSESEALVTYLWVALSPIWHALASTSDFIIVAMTVTR